MIDNNRIFVDDNRFNDLIEVINLMFNNIMIRYLFNVSFITNIDMKKR